MVSKHRPHSPLSSTSNTCPSRTDTKLQTRPLGMCREKTCGHRSTMYQNSLPRKRETTPSGTAFPVSPLLRRSCGESQLWSFSQPRRCPRVVIRARCCAVGSFSDALVAKAGASPVCSGASSLWVAILPSLCSSKGACARNSASSPHFFVMNGHDVLRWLLISGKAFCGCSSCFLVVRLVATMWACCAWLWLGIICSACCESANHLSASRWSRLACFQCWPCSCIARSMATTVAA